MAVCGARARGAGRSGERRSDRARAADQGGPPRAPGRSRAAPQNIAPREGAEHASLRTGHAGKADARLPWRGSHFRVPRRRDDMETSMSPSRSAKRETLNLPIKPQELRLIDRAAESVGKNRTEFVLDAARRAAEEALLDRMVFTVSPKAYAEFLARLDARPRPNKRLRRTMQTAAPWR